MNISVGDGFTTGANSPQTYTHSNNYEFQNYTSITHKAHFIKFGARLRGYLQGNYSEITFRAVQLVFARLLHPIFWRELPRG